MGKGKVKKSSIKKKIKRNLEKEMQRRKEIEEQILKQRKKIEEKSEKKEKKLEEIVEKSRKKIKTPVSLGYGTVANVDALAYTKSYDGKIDYGSLFSYLGAGKKKTFGEDYKELISSDTSIAWSDKRGDKDVMDIKEQEDYAMKQATNFLLGTGMNNISYDEKIRFDAFMWDPSNKIVFLINYGMLGMNYKTPVIKIQANQQTSQKYEVKMTDKEIKEKSMKNDKDVALRFDLKSDGAKDYVK